MIDELKFFDDCSKGICNRHTLKSKRCKLDSKRKACYKKYVKKQNQKFERMIQKDDRWEKTKILVSKRDNNKCQIWEILTQKEQTYILDKYLDDYIYHKDIDHAHIKNKGSYPELKYDPDNVVLVRRLFHSLLDQLKHPVYRTPITSQERENWLIAARDKKKNRKNIEDVIADELKKQWDH